MLRKLRRLANAYILEVQIVPSIDEYAWISDIREKGKSQDILKDKSQWWNGLEGMNMRHALPPLEP